MPTNLANLIKNYPRTKTRLPRELPLFVGMPIFLTYNIAVEPALTNDTTGVVRSIHLKNGEVISGDTGFYHLEHTPDYIIVELDDITMKPLDGLKPNHVSIDSKTNSIPVKLKGKQKTTHFPLVPRFSCTAHKSQGKSYCRGRN